MSNKKKLFILMPTVLIVVFSITYMVSYNKITKSEKLTSYNKIQNSNEKIGINSNKNSVKIIYESIYSKPEGKDSNIIVDEYVEKFNEDKKAIESMTKNQVVAAFKKDDYSLKDVKDNQIVFSRDLNKYKYSSNKYIIGIKDGYIAIFKTDKNGKPFMESPKDITNIRVKDLPKGDIELLERGDKMYEFNTKEEALEGADAIFTT